MSSSRLYSILGFFAILVAVPVVVATEVAAPADASTPAEMQLDFANGLFRDGFFEEAVEEYEKYLAASPQAPAAGVAWYRLGEAAYAAKQYEKALEALTKAAELAPDDETKQHASLSRGEVLYFLKRHPEAETVLAALAAPEVLPEMRGRALYFGGKASQTQQRYDAAEKSYRSLLDALPEHALAPYARYELAFVMLAMNDLEKAAVEFSNVAASGVDPVVRMESRFRAAEIYDKMGWFDAAVGAYEQLRQDFPDSDYAKRAEYGFSWALYRAGKLEEALAAADKFLEAFPESPFLPGMKYLRGNCLQQLKRYDEALAIYAQLREQHGESEFAVRAQYKAAWVYYLKGDSATAKNETLAFINVHKDSPLLGDAHFLLGSIYVTEGNFEDAQQEFQLVAEKYPDSEFAAEALYKSAETLAQLGLTEPAAQAFSLFASRYPDNPLTAQAILRAGDTQFKSANFEQAVAQYQDVLKAPADPAAEHDTLYRLALTYHNMKSYKGSADTFRRLIEKFPQSAHRAEAHYRIGDYTLREGSAPDEALAAYQAAFDVDPKGEYAGPALRGLALARYERKDQDLAASLFLRVTQEYPDVRLNEEAYVWTGQYWFDQQQWDQAVTAFEALLKAVPDYPYPERVHLLIAEAKEKSGQTDEAMKRYQQVVDAAPQTSTAAEARYRMAQMLEGQGQVDKAVELYEAAATANGGETAARAQFHLGELYDGLGQHDKAARSFMRVAILFLHEELSPQALWRAGESFAKAGSADKARKAYEEVIQDYPGTEFANKATESLGKLPQG